MNRSERIGTCAICKQWDRMKNLVPATIEIRNRKWLGKAHLKCIKEYNKTHESKYSVREYDENGKFLGKVTPI